MKNEVGGRKYRWWTATLFLLFAGVLVILVYQVKAQDKPQATAKADFASVVDKMTKKKKVYSIKTFDTVLDVRALYKSSEVRSAFVEDYSAMSLLSEEQKADLRDKEEKEAREGEEFLLAVFTTEEEWGEMNRTDPAWRLYLYDDQNRRLEPRDIRKTSISKAKLWRFYPHVTAWTKLFLVSFPKSLPQTEEPFIGLQTKKIKLVFAGVLGKAELEWELR